MSLSMETMLSEYSKEEFPPEIRQRGLEYYRQGAVNITALGSIAARADVRGTKRNYNVVVDYEDISDEILSVACDCPHYKSGYLCKHIWATLLELENYPVIQRFDIVELEVMGLDVDDWEIETWDIGAPLPMSQYNRSSDARASLPNALTQLPDPSNKDWRSRWMVAREIASRQQVQTPRPTSNNETPEAVRHWFALSLADQVKLPQWKLHLLRSKRTASGDWIVPQPVRMQRHEISSVVDDDERKLLSMLQWDGQHQPQTSLTIDPNLVAETLQQLCRTERFIWALDASDAGSPQTTACWDGGEPWRLKVQVKPAESENQKSLQSSTAVAEASSIHVQPVLYRGEGEQAQRHKIDDVVSVCQSGAVLIGDKLSVVDAESASWVRGWHQIGSLTMPEKELGQFLQAFLKSADPGQLELASDLQFSTLVGTPRPKLTLSAPEDSRASDLIAEVTMLYSDQEVQVEDRDETVWHEENRELIYRNFDAEKEAIQSLERYEFRECYIRYGETELRIARRWFATVVAELTADGWEVVAEGKKMRTAGSFHIEVASSEDWFDLDASADFDGLSAALPTLLQALKKGQSFVVLDDGTHGVLPEEWLNQFAHLADAGTVEGDSVRYKQSQALLLDMMLAEQENVKTDRSFKSFCKRLHAFSGIKPAKEPRGFHGELRKYQQEGLGWFSFLRDFQFGGVLADDMGLGKTVQVLALLQSRRLARPKDGESRKPSLAVVPKSLIFNWVEEARRFAPNLNVLDYTGLDRAERAADLESVDLIVTTYGTLRRDIERLKDIDYDYAILDEAQAIKNPKSQAAKASRLLNADHRLAMTGTPVENHLGDLWSLFDFLNPGMLGQMSVSNFSGANGSEERMTGLSNALRPFILRRTKENVLTELPKKSEQTLHCDMTPKQRKAYEELRTHYRGHLSGKVKELGIKRSKIHVLEALLRLRQAACDPRLVNKTKGVPGAKILRLMEQLQEVTGEGHKALVFSQFTSLLALVRKELDKQKISYEYLDGKTTKRQECVKRFQEDPDCPVFLISLKAGGHGLNLTAADYVYILDPWWNPAVEAQAIDRAHRMGQTKPVMAYRLICRDTVEEKIVHLQESKRDLADAIISADGSLISQLSMDDLQMLFS